MNFKEMLKAIICFFILFSVNIALATDMKTSPMNASMCRTCWMSERVACKEIIDKCRPQNCMDSKGNFKNSEECKTACIKPNQACQKAAKLEFKRCQSFAKPKHYGTDDGDMELNYVTENNWGNIGDCPKAP